MGKCWLCWESQVRKGKESQGLMENYGAFVHILVKYEVPQRVMEGKKAANQTHRAPMRLRRGISLMNLNLFRMYVCMYACMYVFIYLF